MTEKTDGFNLMLDLLDALGIYTILAKAQALGLDYTLKETRWVQTQLHLRRRRKIEKRKNAIDFRGEV